jgi:hypothetical protein
MVTVASLELPAAGRTTVGVIVVHPLRSLAA